MRSRRTFVCLGDAVNLAARLMSKAPAGEIYVSELVRRSAGEGFAWTKLAPLRLKGKAAPVAAYALTGSSGASLAARRRYKLPIVGRGGELARARRGPRRRGRRPGQGRRHLGRGRDGQVAPARRVRPDARRDAGLLVAFGECQSFGTSTSYFVWREIWRTLLGLPRGRAADEQVAALEQALGRDRPGARRARAAARRAARPDDPRHRAHARVRRQAAQDLAREPARRLPARAGARTSRSCSCSRTATGSTRSRATCST